MDSTGFFPDSLDKTSDSIFFKTVFKGFKLLGRGIFSNSSDVNSMISDVVLVSKGVSLGTGPDPSDAVLDSLDFCEVHVLFQLF